MKFTQHEQFRKNIKGKKRGAILCAGNDWIEQMEQRRLLSAAVASAAPKIVSATNPAETITLLPSTTFQTIQGWLSLASLSGSAFQQTQGLNMLVNDLGLTGLRLEAPGGNLVGQPPWEAEPAEDLTTFAKTGSPADPTYSAFNAPSTDDRVTNVVIPFQNLVNARQANAFTLYTSSSFYNFGGTGHIPTWMDGNPGEYAENLVSFDEYLKTTFGIVPTYMTILNEEDNGTHMTPALNAEIIRAVGPLLQKDGLDTKILAGETVTPADVLPTAPAGSNYVSSLTPDDWRYIAGISYHNYGGAAQVGAVSTYAQSQGVFTSEDESTDGTALVMYNDLANGNDSFSMPQYGVEGFGSSTTTNTGSLINAGIDQGSIQPGESYFDFRQIMDYVRPGAVRISDSSADNNIESMAFQDNGQVTTILINQANNGNAYTPVAKTMTITGLPNGVYGMSASIGGSSSAPGTPEELGVQTVTNGTLTFTDPANSILTVYPRTVGVTLAPYIWQSSATSGGATYLLSGGATSATLKATAIDPQLDAMSYTWSVISQPAGASVSLVNPNSATATANGLAVVGQYVFSVTASNGTTSSTRQVAFNVFSGPQQPIVQVVENRSPPSGTVPASIGTTLHLPTETSTQLWAQLAYDLQGASVTGTWTYVSGPEPTTGAGAPVLTNENIAGLPAGYIASNLTVAGNYDFRLTATDGITAPVVQDLIVTVDAANPATSLTNTNAGGAYVSPGNGSLHGTVTDTNGGGQWVSSWWDVVTQPVGSNITFADQTAANTTFNVDTAGTYTFELYSVDQTLAATSTIVTVNVLAVATPTITSISPAIGPQAGGTIVTITGTNFTAATSVKFGNVNATDFVVNSTTSITAKSPAEAMGSVDVTVTTPIGTSATGAGDKFTFDDPPTVFTAAGAAPNPVTTTTTTNLTVLGADDGGEANLTYSWATTGTPPATVNFAPNGTNAAKSTTATFTKSGVYSFFVTITDASGLTVTSPVSVTVDAALTSITVSPAGTSVTVNTSKQFSATAFDQFGLALLAQPAFAWGVNGGGTIDGTGLFSATTIGGPFTITASSGGISGTASVNVAPATVTNVSPAIGPPAGGTVVTITGTGFSAATAVRFGNVNAASFTINSATSITATTPVETMGVVDVTIVTASGNSAITAADRFTFDAPPTVATSPSAAPNPVTGSTAALGVLGADDGGEANLTYTWVTTGSPPAAAGIAPNGTNAAKNATVTFTRAGVYNFQVTITDANGLTTTSALQVTVNLTLTSITLAPANPSVALNGTRQFSATGFDQFGVALTPQPTFTWSASGGGTINAAGLFTATTVGGPFAITATSGSVIATTNVTVTNTVTLYSLAGDGRASSFNSSGNTSANWDTVHDNTTTTNVLVDYTTANRTNLVGFVESGNVAILRGFLPFDTSSIPANAVITSATVGLFITGVTDNLKDGNDFASVVQGFEASSTSLAAGDYSLAGNSIDAPTEGSNRVGFGNITVSAYAQWTLNASGISWLKPGGISQLALREGHDILDVYPGAASQTDDIGADMSETAGTAMDPYLQITYTIPHPNLGVSISDGGATVPGQRLVYNLNYSNTGAVKSTGVTLTETLPANTTFDSADSSPGWSLVGGSTYSYPVGSVNFGANGSAAFALTINTPVAAGSQLSDSASISDDGANGTDSQPANNSATDTYALPAFVSTSLSVSGGAGAAIPGKPITYNFVVRNDGIADVSGINVADLLPASIDPFSVVYSASDNGLGAAGYTASGSGAINDTVSLPAGSSISYSITGNILSSQSGNLTTTASGTVPAGIVNSEANVNGSTVANQSSSTVTLAPAVELGVVMNGANPLHVGQQDVYTLVVTNFQTIAAGSDAAMATINTDALAQFTGIHFSTAVLYTPDNAVTPTFTTGSGTVANGAVFSDTFNLSSGSIIEFQITGTVAAGATGTIANTSTVADPGFDVDPSNNSSSVTAAVATVNLGSVVGRSLFYGNSFWDNTVSNPSFSKTPDTALAPDKLALMPGQKARFSNYSSYTQGINGIFVDITGDTGSIALSDFNFVVGNDNTPTLWSAAPTPSSISLYPGAGVNGSDRVQINWANSAILNKWLQVTVLAGKSDTNLAVPDVFYFGNAPGEVGNSTSDAFVNASDDIAARNDVHTTVSDPATLANPHDYNRDSKVNGTDEIFDRGHHTNGGNGIFLITPSTPGVFTLISRAASSSGSSKSAAIAPISSLILIDPSDDKKTPKTSPLTNASIIKEETVLHPHAAKAQPIPPLRLHPGIGAGASPFREQPIR